jgi:hypothetical protein
MTKGEQISILIKAEQIYTYDEWFEQIGYIYGLMNMHHSPAEKYAEYVDAKLKEHFGSSN